MNYIAKVMVICLFLGLINVLKASVVPVSGGNTYLVVNLLTWEHRYTDTAPDLNDDICRTTELWLRRIPAGTYMMGSPAEELGRYDDEVQHEVTISKDYYLGVFECTKKQWELVMGTDENGVARPREQYVPGPDDNPSVYPEGITGDTHPRNNISYNEIRGKGWPQSGRAPAQHSFMGILLSRTGLLFDLPTEAEWEYACRAGTTTAFNSGKDLTSSDGHDKVFDEVGRNYHNRDDGKGGFTSFTEVGHYLPNAWGLYDMHGNLAEFCLDWFSLEGYDTTQSVDPVGASTGAYRIVRGGYWWEIQAGHARSAYRDGYNGNDPTDDAIGFRVGCFIEEEPQSSVDIMLLPGWNLVVMPNGVDVVNNLGWLKELNPFMYVEHSNSYAQAWVPLEMSRPLWIYSSEIESFRVVCGDDGKKKETELVEGWQLIGMDGDERKVLKDSRIQAVWRWNGHGFEPIAAQEDGSYQLGKAGYWVLCSE